MPEGIQKKIEKFFASEAFGVAGASNNRAKFGNKVLRAYIQHHKKVHPINPHEKSVEGILTISHVAELPDDVESISIITPPAITEKIVEAAIRKGIKNIWMQPGAESDTAISACEQNGINVIARGPCVLVVLGFQG